MLCTYEIIAGFNMTDATMTLRLSSDLKKRLDIISSVTKRSKSFLASEAVARFIEAEEEYIEGIAEARMQYSRGEIVPHDEAMRQIRSYIKKSQEAA
jgi:predicted transcriptional regulator